MLLHQLSLTDRCTELRTAAPSGAGRRIMSNALHTMIAAIFARIFARLEALLLLWQSGQLPTRPPTAPARTTARTPRHPATPARTVPAGPAPHIAPRPESAAHRPPLPRPAPPPPAHGPPLPNPTRTAARPTRDVGTPAKTPRSRRANPRRCYYVIVSFCKMGIKGPSALCRRRLACLPIPRNLL